MPNKYRIDHEGLCKDFKSLVAKIGKKEAKNPIMYFNKGWGDILSGKVNVKLGISDNRVTIVCPNANALRSALYACRLVLTNTGHFKNSLHNETTGKNAVLYTIVEATIKVDLPIEERQAKELQGLWPHKERDLGKVRLRKSNIFSVSFRNMPIFNLIVALQSHSLGMTPREFLETTTKKRRSLLRDGPEQMTLFSTPGKKPRAAIGRPTLGRPAKTAKLPHIPSKKSTPGQMSKRDLFLKVTDNLEKGIIDEETAKEIMGS